MLAGSARKITPRMLEASELRISSNLPSANWAEKVGMAAMATDCAMAACAINIKEKPYRRPATLPETICEASEMLTQKLSCTTATPSTRGPIRRKTSRTAAFSRPRMGV